MPKKQTIKPDPPADPPEETPPVDPPEETPPAPPEETAPNGKPARRDDGTSALVRVTVKRAINIDGLVIRPAIDDSSRNAGRPPVIAPIEAVIPRRVVRSYGPDYVEVIASAPPDAVIGPC